MCGSRPIVRESGNEINIQERCCEAGVLLQVGRYYCESARVAVGQGRSLIGSGLSNKKAKDMNTIILVSSVFLKDFRFIV